MFLLADNINGVRCTNWISAVEGNFIFMSQDLFYKSLGSLENNEQIITTPSLSMCKKIHKEYNITRY